MRYDLFMAGIALLGGQAWAGGANVRINEFDASNETGLPDEREFIELYDGGAGGTALDGLVVVLFDGSTDTSYAAFDLDGQETGVDGFFVLGSSQVPTADQVVGISDFIRDLGAIVLYQGDAADFPNGTPVSFLDIVDAVVYRGVISAGPGLAPLLLSGSELGATIHYGQGASLGRCPDGAGDPRDSERYTARLATPGEPSECPSAAEFCNGLDGATASCPCGPGFLDAGCVRPIPSMQGGGQFAGTRLEVVSQVTSPGNSAELRARGFPSGSTVPSLVFRSRNRLASAAVFGDGLLCTASPVVRVDSAAAFAGLAIYSFGHGAMAGSGLFYYQSWMRSTPSSFCDPGAAFNTSSGVTLQW